MHKNELTALRKILTTVQKAESIQEVLYRGESSSFLPSPRWEHSKKVKERFLGSLFHSLRILTSLAIYRTSCISLKYTFYILYFKICTFISCKNLENCILSFNSCTEFIFYAKNLENAFFLSIHTLCSSSNQEPKVRHQLLLGICSIHSIVRLSLYVILRTWEIETGLWK